MPHAIGRRLAQVLLMLLATQVGAQASTVITFLHLNDLHANLVPHLDQVRQADGGSHIAERGGLARIATLVKRVRAKNPNTVLMNIGDTYHGGAEALFSNGNAIVGPMNALGVDLAVPGNWDYAYGPGVTWARFAESAPPRLPGGLPSGPIARPSFKHLAANVTAKQLPGGQRRTFLAPTAMRKIGGVKVGFIGLSSDIVPMMHPVLAAGLDFAQGEQAHLAILERYARQLRNNGARIVVVMSELGIHKDYRLAQDLPKGSVDLFFSAHTHELTYQPLHSASGALVVESGDDSYLGRMDVTVSRGKIVATKWRVLQISNKVPEDPHMAKVVAAARAPFVGPDVHVTVDNPSGSFTLDRSIDTVVGYSAALIDRRQSLDNSFNRLFTDALRDQAGTQVALSPGFRFDSVLAPAGEPLEGDAVAQGSITLADVYRFFPVHYSLATGTIDGRHLRQILEDNLTHVYATDVFIQGGGWMDGVSGLRVDLDLTAPDGQRIRRLRYQDSLTRVRGSDQVTVAGCQRPLDAADVLCSYPGFSDITPLLDPVSGAPYTPQALLIATLAGQTVEAPRQPGLHDHSNTPMWPDGPYLQPLEGAQP